MSTVVLDHRLPDRCAPRVTRYRGGGTSRSVVVGRLHRRLRVLSFPELSRGNADPVLDREQLVTTLAFGCLAMAVPTLRRVLDVPRWALYLSSAAFAAVAAMSWSLATLAPDMAKSSVTASSTSSPPT